MSQPYYSAYPQQQYYAPDSYDSVNSMHPPIHSNHSHTSTYEHQNQYYDNTGAHNFNDSSVLAQSYTYSDANYAPDANYASNTGYTSDANTEAYSHYDSAPNHTHDPDSANQIPHQDVPQYGDAAPAHTWTGPVQHPEPTPAHQGEFHDHRRGSCASVNTDSTGWHSHGNVNDGHQGYTQPSFQQAHNANHHHYQPQPDDDPINFGMYSPTQHLRTQELAHTASYDTHHWVPVSTGFEAPYGTLPVHDARAKFERRSSDAYQGFNNGSIGHHAPQASPSIQSHASTTGSSLPQSSPQDEYSRKVKRDLFIQQRQAADYQHGLQAQQQLKYQQSAHFGQYEATHRRQESFSIDQNYSYTLAHDTPHHHNHPAHHHRQNSTASGSRTGRLASAPIVPSQARERPAPYHIPSPVEEKKDVPQKKPALACLFCRKRKIACGAPPPDSLDRTCNQCARRKLDCEYPTESRRGIRKTQVEPAPEEPTVHKFVDGAATQESSFGPIRNRKTNRKGKGRKSSN